MGRTISEWVNLAHDAATRSGFHEGDEQRSLRDKVASWCMNLHSEVSELWEAFRDNRLHAPCDKAERMVDAGIGILKPCVPVHHGDGSVSSGAAGPCWQHNTNQSDCKFCRSVVRGLTCLEEEMADIAIRLFDDAGAMGIDLEAAIEAKFAYNRTRSHRHGGKAA